MKKYELCLDKKISVFGVTFFRIKALISFGDVKAGEIGGYIEKEENLSQSGNAWVFDNAQVFGSTHYIQMGPIGSRDDVITFMRTKDLKIAVKTGCFFGTIEEFEEKVKETHGNSHHAKEYLLAAEIARSRIDLTSEEEG